MTDLFTPDFLPLVRQYLRDTGYQDDLIRTDYEFRSARKQGPSVQTIPMAAFAQAPLSERNSCLGIALPPNHTPEAVRRLRDLGAPQIIALHPEERLVRRWRMTADIPENIDVFDIEDIASVFEARKNEWAPSRILEAKRSLPVDLPDWAAQLDFFDQGLMPALEADLRRKLDKDIQGVLAVCRNKYEQWDKGPFDAVQEPIFRLIFRLIAAKMLIDRGMKSEWRSLGASAVLQNVDDFYFSGESEAAEPPLDDVEVQTAAWHRIRDGLDLQNLSVETLAYIYENTFVSKAVRHTLGVHATPPEIAEYVVRQLPIKELAEQERTVFEPFTGPAPFLVAALGRLRDLTTATDDATRHDYFRQMLTGVEADPFAHEIARYSLILADYPNPDGWRIAPEDAFVGPKFDEYLQQSNIVLCNPPFGSFGTDERPNGALFQRDAEALRRVLLYPPLMLGFVLPRSFLTRDECRPLRKQMSDLYRNILVIVLPTGIFQKAEVETVLVIAHNNTQHLQYRAAFVSSADRRQFLRTGEPTWETEQAILLNQDGEVVLWQQEAWLPLWSVLSECDPLGSIADIRRGIEYNKPTVECVSDQPRPGFVSGVQTVNGYLEPLIIGDHQYLNVAPAVMKYFAYRLPWHQPKVLINKSRSSRGYWSVAGATDDKGLVASQQLYGAWPKGNKPIELLAALVSSPIANAYLYAHRGGSRDNTIRLIKRIPIPQVNEEQTKTIVELVQDYQSCRDQWLAEPRRGAFFKAKCLERLWQIDAEVLAAYDLPQEVEQDLLAKFSGAERRPLPFDFPGYGEGYEQAKLSLQAEKEYQNTVKQYQSLVKKKYGPGLTTTDIEEMERLGQKLDDRDAPNDQAILNRLQTGDR